MLFICFWLKKFVNIHFQKWEVLVIDLYQSFHERCGMILLPFFRGIIFHGWKNSVDGRRLKSDFWLLSDKIILKHSVSKGLKKRIISFQLRQISFWISIFFDFYLKNKKDTFSERHRNSWTKWRQRKNLKTQNWVMTKHH